VKANELKPGVACIFDGKLYVVTKTEHVKPGKGPAYVQARLKDPTGGGYIEKRVGSSDTIEGTHLDRRKSEYLYQDSDGYVFMDSESFDQFTLQEDLAAASMPFLRPNTVTDIVFHNEKAIIIELPSAVDLEVTECQPGIKGATVTNQLKEAVLETGLKTRVPPFIEIGETVRVSTDDGSYMSRAK
jgi:elongation factor P